MFCPFPVQTCIQTHFLCPLYPPVPVMQSFSYVLKKCAVLELIRKCLFILSRKCETSQTVVYFGEISFYRTFSFSIKSSKPSHFRKNHLRLPANFFILPRSFDRVLRKRRIFFCKTNIFAKFFLFIYSHDSLHRYKISNEFFPHFTSIHNRQE
jgi:hypothetical protein